MDGLFGRGATVHDLTPEKGSQGMQEGRILLVDVREDRETALERIPGALLMPLSTFDPMDIPDPQGRQVVFSCNSGNRSVKASEIAQAAGLAYDAHLAGGIKGWRAAGFPTET